MATYFITGGLGFIGFHLTERLLNQGEKVIIYDAQKHYVPLDRSNWTYYLDYRIQKLRGRDVEIVRGDCTDAGWLKESLEKYKPDVIVHLAALPIAGISNDYPAEARGNIFDSTVTLLDTLKNVKFSFDRVLYTSSSMVYGEFLRDDNQNIIAASEDQVCNPIDIYGAMKLSGEYMVKAYNYRFGIPYVIIRPSAVYGHTDCNMRVTEMFLLNAIRKMPLLVENKGMHQVDFTFIDDLIDGYILCAKENNALGQTFNLTHGQGRTIGELADILMQLVPGATIEMSDVMPYRPNRGTLNIAKATRLLGYQPKVSLEEGMKRYYEQIIKDNIRRND